MPRNQDQRGGAPQSTFTQGEISPDLYGRIDFDGYYRGLKTCRNFIVSRCGGVDNRPGTLFVGYLPGEEPYIPSPEESPPPEEEDYLSGDLVLMVAMYYDDLYNETSGIVAVVYDTVGESWRWLGDDIGGGPVDSVPNTARINPKFAAYYGSWSIGNDYDNEYMRLHIFDELGTHTYDLWHMDYPNYLVGVFRDTEVWNTMDIHISGIVSCIAYIDEEAEVIKDAWAVKVSEDRGVNWKAIHYFPTCVYGAFGSANTYISSTEEIYVQYVDGNSILIYALPSLDGSWELRGTILIAADRSISQTKYRIGESGEYQYLFVRSYKSPTTYWDLYFSDDYGANWTDVNEINIGLVTAYFVCNDQYVVFTKYAAPSISSRFQISSDYGSSFSIVDPLVSMSYTYIDMQNYLKEIAYTECGSDFIEDYYLGMMYSTDNGTGWEIVQSPLPTTDETHTIDGHTYTHWWFQQSIDITNDTEGS